eukprot:GHVS01065199.1.p1 GENE.GHVS01065199.1~~GHVS01065199.1.p1  ORF type:complete len:268 (+),score=6.43 GHVS01065199.1:3-806(+)
MFSNTGWVVVPLDTKRIDVSVDTDGTPSFVLLRGIESTCHTLLSVLGGVHLTVNSENGDFTFKSILKLMGKDLEMLQGPPNEYAKDIVAARDNVNIGGLVAREHNSKLRGVETPAEWKKPLPFFYTDTNSLSATPWIWRDAAKRIVFHAGMTVDQKRCRDLLPERVTEIDDNSIVFFESLIGQVVKIGDVKYTVTRPKDKGIFTLVKNQNGLSPVIGNDSSPEDCIKITRAYRTSRNEYAVAFIFNEGVEETSRGFAWLCKTKWGDL